MSEERANYDAAAKNPDGWAQKAQWAQTLRQELDAVEMAFGRLPEEKRTDLVIQAAAGALATYHQQYTDLLERVVKKAFS